MNQQDPDADGRRAATSGTHLYGPDEMLSLSILRRIRRIARIATLTAALCAIVIGAQGDWPDASIAGLTGVLTLSIARSVTWRMRQWNPRSYEV
jgi:hypothetical protein